MTTIIDKFGAETDEPLPENGPAGGGLLRLFADLGPAAVRHPAVLRAGAWLFAAMATVVLVIPQLAVPAAAAGAVVFAAGLVARLLLWRAPVGDRPERGIFHLGASVASGRSIWLTAEECRENLLVTGPSAVRTEACLVLASDAMAAGSGLVYVDGNGDVSLYARTYALARRYGREDDLLVLNFMTSNAREAEGEGRLLSNTLNPFTTGSADALTQMVVSLMDDFGSSGAMWKGRAIALFTGVMRALVWQRDAKGTPLDVGRVREHLNLTKIIDFANVDLHPEMPAEVRGAVDAYLTSLPGFQRDKGSKQAQTTLDQHGFLQMQFTKILGELADVYGHVFLQAKGQVDMEDVALNRRILVVMLPALEKSADEVANLGKILVATLKAMMGSVLGAGIEADGGRLGARAALAPLTVIFDNFQYYTVSGMGVMAGLARAANISFVFSCNPVDALSPLDQREVRAVLSECGWRLEFLPEGKDAAVLMHRGSVEVVRPAWRPEAPHPDQIRVNHTI